MDDCCCRGTRKRITMCGAYQLFTTSTPSFEQEGPTEPTEAPENLDENFVNNRTDDRGTQDNNTDSKSDLNDVEEVGGESEE